MVIDAQNTAPLLCTGLENFSFHLRSPDREQTNSFFLSPCWRIN